MTNIGITITKKMRGTVRTEQKDADHGYEKWVSFDGEHRQYTFVESMESRTMVIKQYDDRGIFVKSIEMSIADFDFMIELMRKPYKRLELQRNH